MTWENAKRTRAKVKRRRDYHDHRIATADTSRKKLSALCGALISEAWQAGRIDEIHTWIGSKLHELRKEATSHDRHAE